MRALGYLKEMLDLALIYEPKRSDHFVEGFSDASFAPYGSRNVGCSLTRYLEQPMSWRCGRQALLSLSVAEAELIEARPMGSLPLRRSFTRVRRRSSLDSIKRAVEVGRPDMDETKP